MNGHLRELNLSMNGCHEDGTRAIISALRYNDTLKELNLNANRVGEEGAKTLAKALPYLRLESIQVRGLVKYCEACIKFNWLRVASRFVGL